MRRRSLAMSLRMLRRERCGVEGLVACDWIREILRESQTNLGKEWSQPQYVTPVRPVTSQHVAIVRMPGVDGTHTPLDIGRLHMSDVLWYAQIVPLEGFVVDNINILRIFERSWSDHVVWMPCCGGDVVSLVR